MQLWFTNLGQKFSWESQVRTAVLIPKPDHWTCWQQKTYQPHKFICKNIVSMSLWITLSFFSKQTNTFRPTHHFQRISWRFDGEIFPSAKIFRFLFSSKKFTERRSSSFGMAETIHLRKSFCRLKLEAGGLFYGWGNFVLAVVLAHLLVFGISYCFLKSREMKVKFWWMFVIVWIFSRFDCNFGSHHFVWLCCHARLHVMDIHPRNQKRKLTDLKIELVLTFRNFHREILTSYDPQEYWR